MDNAPEPPSGGKPQDRAPARAPARAGTGTARKPSAPRKGVAKNGGSKTGAKPAAKTQPKRSPAAKNARDAAVDKVETAAAEPDTEHEVLEVEPDASAEPAVELEPEELAEAAVAEGPEETEPESSAPDAPEPEPAEGEAEDADQADPHDADTERLDADADTSEAEKADLPDAETETLDADVDTETLDADVDTSEADEADLPDAETETPDADADADADAETSEAEEGDLSGAEDAAPDAPDAPEPVAPDAAAPATGAALVMARVAASTRTALDRAGAVTRTGLSRAGAATTAATAAASAWLKRTADATRPRIERAAEATRDQVGVWRRAVAADVAEVREQWVEARESRAQRTAEREALVSGPVEASASGSVEAPRAALETPAPPADRETVELVVTPSPATAGAARGGTALSVRGLSKRFGETVAVDAVDLDVPEGSFYGLVGPNGAGKTTLLSMISGLLRPDAGAVLVHGTDVWRDPVATKREMGVLPDRLRLFDRLTGSQLLYYSAMLRGLNRPTARKRTADLASVFGIEDALGRLVTDYSTGMTKKVALAAAMIHAPRLLVLDEPFESVDPVSAATVTEILRKYALAGGTVVLSSHSMDLVQRMCDRVAVIVEGSIIAEGTVAEVRGATTLQERFVELAGRKSVEELSWLHGSSS